MHKTILLLCFLPSVLACDKDKSATPAAPAPSAPTAAPPAAAPAPAAPPAGALNVSCEKLIPGELVTKHFAGATIDGSPGPRSGFVTCKAMVDAAKGDFRMVSYACTGESDAVLQKTMEVGKRALTDAVDVPGVGRAAYANKQMLQFWDDDTACYVTMAGFNEASAAVAKDLAAALNPAALK